LIRPVSGDRIPVGHSRADPPPRRNGVGKSEQFGQVGALLV
jgi:hypothetical protein